LVAGNLLDSSEVVRKRSDFHPKNVQLFKNRVEQFEPKKNTVVLRFVH
jgi:hypothetical protein